MKTRNILLTLTLFITTLPGLTSCGVDRWQEYAAETEVDQWIAEVMRENYLWYKDMPKEKELNFFIAPDAFLKAVVSKEDNNTSYIDTLYKEPLPTYGFDYSLYRVADNDTAYNALVTYVLPQSPAAAAGLKRGDWIMQVNDKVITSKNESKLFETGLALSLQLGAYTVQADPETQEQVGIVVKSGTATLVAAAVVEDDPVHHHQVITTANGTKAGYIVYSHFTAGTATNPEQYNDRLRTISREFAEAGVTHLILDMRYNRGGSLACAQLLCALVAPKSLLGSPLGSLTYNDKQASKNSALMFDSQLIGSGSNLNITQGFILSSGETAGVSGVLLNLLLPLERWALVGSSVSCSGVATDRFDNPQGTWSLNPVVCEVFNSLKESGRGGSFTTAQTVNETTDLSKFLPFGDKNEALLGTVIGLIDGTIKPTKAVAQTPSMKVKEVIHTPSRKTKENTTL